MGKKTFFQNDFKERVLLRNVDSYGDMDKKPFFKKVSRYFRIYGQKIILKVIPKYRNFSRNVDNFAHIGKKQFF